MTHPECYCRDKEAWFGSLVSKAHSLEVERRLAEEETQRQKLERRAKIRAKAAVRWHMHMCSMPADRSRQSGQNKSLQRLCCASLQTMTACFSGRFSSMFVLPAGAAKGPGRCRRP